MKGRYRYDEYNSEVSANLAFVPALARCLQQIGARRVFEVGCGNGSVANALAAKGYEIVGVDPSESGITEANRCFPHLRLQCADGYDDLGTRFGLYEAVVSVEVIEHMYDPRLFLRRCFELLKPSGTLLLTTPFHGYWKNLAIALLGRMDAHWNPLWDGGHIKFWSERTLRAVLLETGFQNVKFRRLGRVAPLAKSMLAVASRPGA